MSQFSLRCVVASTLVALSTFICAPAPAATVTFETGEFIDAEWTSTPSGTGSSTVTTEATGGNPDAFRRISLSVTGGQGAKNVQLWTVATFDPSTQGSVNSVTISYDIASVFTSLPAASQIAKGFAASQGGTIRDFLDGVSTSATFEPVSRGDVVNQLDTIDWASGGPITFGFFNSVFSSIDTFTIDGGYDNYKVVIDFTPPDTEPPVIPLPAGVWGGMLLLGAIVGARLRASRRA